MEKKLRMTPEQVLEQATLSVRFARKHRDDIEFSPEDGSRSDPDFLCRVLEAVIFIGQREHGFRKERNRRLAIAGCDVDSEFAGAGAEEMTANADMVAEVEELVEGEGVFADVVFANVDLEALAAPLDLREAGFALDANGHDAAGDRNLGAAPFELFARLRIKLRAQLGDGDGPGVAVGVGGLGLAQAVLCAQRGDALQLFEALIVQPLLKLTLVHACVLDCLCRLLMVRFDSIYLQPWCNGGRDGR